MNVSVRASFRVQMGSVPAPEPTPILYDGWRGLYRIEGGNYHAWEQPAVIPSQYRGIKYGTKLTFTEPLQRLSWALTQYTNPLMTMKNWASVWAGDTVLTNYNGWDNAKEPDDQRHDYIQNRYVTYPDPEVMDAIFLAGNFIKLEARADGHLWAIPGWSGIDVTKPLPTVTEILEKGWWMRMTINGRNGPYDFSQGRGGAVIVPYFLKEEVPYTPSHFIRWQSDELPNPLKVYL